MMVRPKGPEGLEAQLRLGVHVASLSCSLHLQASPALSFVASRHQGCSLCNHKYMCGYGDAGQDTWRLQGGNLGEAAGSTSRLPPDPGVEVLGLECSCLERVIRF